jgi:hypothetical protein
LRADILDLPNYYFNRFLIEAGFSVLDALYDANIDASFAGNLDEALARNRSRINSSRSTDMDN